MMHRHNVKVELASHSVYGSLIGNAGCEPDSVTAVIRWLAGLLDHIPDHQRETARIEIESVGGYEGEHHAQVSVYYERPETDEEMQARMNRERSAAEREEAKERAAFERLRKKYG